MTPLVLDSKQARVAADEAGEMLVVDQSGR